MFSGFNEVEYLANPNLKVIKKLQKIKSEYPVQINTHNHTSSHYVTFHNEFQIQNVMV